MTSLHQRWFAKRRILASTWDGKTKYEVEETEQQREERLKKWENFLETGVKPADEKSKDLSADSKLAKRSDKESDRSKQTVEAKSSNEMENSRVTVNTGNDDKSSDGAKAADSADGSSDVTLSKSSAEDSSVVTDSADGKSDVKIATSTDSADGSADRNVNTNSADKSSEGTEMTESAEYSSVSANSADEKKDGSTSVSGEGWQVVMMEFYVLILKVSKKQPQCLCQHNSKIRDLSGHFIWNLVSFIKFHMKWPRVLDSVYHITC